MELGSCNSRIRVLGCLKIPCGCGHDILLSEIMLYSYFVYVVYKDALKLA
jgi:hypothetical protein